MFNKKTILIFGGLFTLLIFFIILMQLGSNQLPTVSPPPIPTSTPFIPATPPPAASNQNIQLQRQTQADINYINAQNQVLSDYPWYNDLPLQADNYFVLFDLSTKSLRAKIYPQRSSSTSVDDQVKLYTAEILEKLKQVGIDTTLYKIDWSINPE